MRKSCLLVLIALFYIFSLKADNEQLLSNPLIFGGSNNYPPYEYLDKHNEPAGFNVDLTKAIAREMNLDIEIQLGSYDLIEEKLLSGEIDIIIGKFLSEKETDDYCHSRAHNHIEMSIVKRKDDQRIRSGIDIHDREIITVSGEIVYENLPKLKYAGRIINVPTAEEAVELLAGGSHDLALLNTRQTAYWLQQRNITGLNVLPHSSFFQEYCYASTIHNEAVIAVLNKGLAKTIENGVYDELEHKWLANYSAERQERQLLITRLMTIIIPLLIILATIFFWQWLLKIKVGARAKELAKELEAHKKTAEKLKKSRNRYHNLVTNLPEIFFEANLEGKILFVNNNFHKTFLYSKDDIDRGMQLSELIIPGQQEQIDNFFSRLFTEKQQAIGDFTGMKKDGTTFPLRIFATRDSTEQNIEIFGIIIDLFHQIRNQLTQKALYEISEAVHNAKDIDELFANIHKITAKLMPADNFYIALYDDKKEQLNYPFYVNKTEDKAPLLNPGVGLTEYVFKKGNALLAKKDTIEKLGQEGKIEIEGEPAKVWLGIPLKVDKEIIGVIAVQDFKHEDTYDEKDEQVLTFISEQIAIAIERKQNSEQLKTTLAFLEDKVKERTAKLSRSEELFRTLAENSENIIMLFDRDLRHLYVNPVVEKYTKAENYPGMKAADFIGKTHKELGFPDDYIALWEKALTYAFETGESVRIEFQLPNGAWIDWHLVPDISPDGKTRYVITTAHDMTELKNREEEIKKLNIELEQRVIERTKQLKEEIKVREQAEKIQHTLFLISEAVSTTLDIQELYQSIHKAVQELMKADNFSIALYDEEHNIVSFPYNFDEFDSTPLPHKPGKGLTEYVLRTGTSLLAKTEDVEKLIADGEVKLVGNMAKVWLGIPLKFKDTVTGVIMVQDYHSEDTYKENDRQLLTFVSEQINHAIERKETEYQNNLQRIYFEQLFNSNPAGIIMVDSEDNILTCNASFTKIFGYSEEEIIGRQINDLIVPDSMTVEADKLSNETIAGEIVEKETVRKTKDGKDVYVKIFGVPVSVEGKQVAIFGIYLDITDLQNALSSYFDEKEKLSVMLASIGEGVIATDINTRILLLNKNAEDLTGWQQEEAVGKNLQKVFHVISGNKKDACKNVVEKVLKTEEIVQMTNNTVLISRDGSEFVIESSAAPIKDRKGKVIGVILVFRDITERRIIEEELRKSAKLESVGILAGGIAHDFNNILTALLGNITLSRRILSDTNPDVSEKLQEAERATIRAKDLTQQLLTFSKGGDPIKKTTSIKEIIKEAATFATHGSIVSCSYYIADNLMNVEADLGQISQVINNMTINSVQAMPNGGKVVVKAENILVGQDSMQKMEPGKYVKITIKDSGIGIARSQLSKIFDPFYTTKRNGSGLGLATSYTIIEKHDGYLTVDSTVGVGTIITIYLPASEKTIAISEEEKIDEVRGKGKILIMDDDQVLIEVVTEMMSNLGYNVTSANEGKSTIAKYKEMKNAGTSFDAVILDLTIPGGMGGKDTIKEIIDFDPEAVCIVSSGYSSDPVMSNYKDYGFKAVLTKPYSLQQLGSTIKKVLG